MNIFPFFFSVVEIFVFVIAVLGCLFVRNLHPCENGRFFLFLHDGMVFFFFSRSTGGGNFSRIEFFFFS